MKKRKKFLGVITPEIKPLDQRFNRDNPMELRKGMKRTTETVNINFLEKEQLFFDL